MADLSFTTYYDFRWPFVYNAAVRLSKVRETTGQSVEVDWQPFSLAQVNRAKCEDFKACEQTEMVSTMVQVGEVKHPQPPWPHGVIQGRHR
jgi:predicted DsbA family dithiol-disulfide isomerase